MALPPNCMQLLRVGKSQSCEGVPLQRARADDSEVLSENMKGQEIESVSTPDHLARLETSRRSMAWLVESSPA